MFTPFHFRTDVAYSDIVYLGFICSFALIYKFKEKLKDKNPNNNSLFTDTPISVKDQDDLGYESYAKRVAEKIAGSTVDQSFAIGINGKWGVGKTSFLNLIKFHLLNKDIISINFNPWSLNSEDKIANEFFDVVLNEVKYLEYDLYKVIRRYTDEYLNTSEDGRLDKIVSLFDFSNNSVSSLHEEINKLLRVNNKKLVIYIDDLDRLQSSEIVDILRLIRVTANFHNSFFVVAYDREYLTNAISKFTAFKNPRYVEKIFQLELSLPYSDNISLTASLSRNLKEIFPEDIHKEIEDEILFHGKIKESYLNTWIENMRDVTRISNSLSINLNILIGEILFSDFLKVELLRIKFPIIYKLIAQDPEKFLILDSRQYRKSKYLLRNDMTKRVYNKYSEVIEQTTIYKYLDENKTSFKTDARDNRKIANLMNVIFNDSNVSKEGGNFHLSVIYPSKYQRYFMYTLPSGNLSNVEFSRARGYEIHELKTKIKSWVKDGMEAELRERFRDVKSFDDFTDFKKMFTAILFMGELPSQKSNFPTIGIDADDLRNKIYHVKRNFNNDDSYITELRIFLKEVFRFNNNYVNSQSDAISFWRSEFNQEFILTSDEMDDLLVSYIREYVSTHHKISKVFWNLFYNCKISNWHATTSDTYQKGEPFHLNESIDLLKDFIMYHDLDGFILSIISQKRMESNMYKILKSVEEIFTSWDDFYEFIFSLKINDSIYLDEFKSFMSLLKVKGYNDYVLFKFNFIPTSDL